MTNARAVASLVLGSAVALAASCGGNKSAPLPEPGPDASATNADCPPCVTDDDCGGGVCAQLGADSYCAPQCPNGNECASDRSCMPATTVSGEQKAVCVPRSDVCGGGPSIDDAGTTDPCGSLAAPTVPSSCTSCTPGSSKCQANGCFGGWFCNITTSKCQAPPTNCATDGGVVDLGAPITGQVGPTGGSVSRLLFSVVGDTRPAFINQINSYPTKIITQIYQDIAALKPTPSFVVSTGDYVFATASGTQAAQQFDLYLGARAKYSGTLFPALGNHECTGMTDSNCGAGNKDGTTNNYASFLSKMLAPIAKTDPYYSVDVNALDSSWTAKFVFVAGNAWSNAQATWLEAQMARPTTYTFVVRHEPSAANTAPGVTPSDTIIGRHPYTLLVVGHTHTYGHNGREVLFGNGGAPLTGSRNYGFGVFSQRGDGAIVVDAVDMTSGATDTGFHFAVKADGSYAPP